MLFFQIYFIDMVLKGNYPFDQNNYKNNKEELKKMVGNYEFYKEFNDN